MEQRQKTGSSPFLKKPFGGMDAMTLRLLAILCMVLDHLWATLVPGSDWMTFLGRLAFPIFAFQISEGFFHTADVRRYAKRLLLFAIISEIPFDLNQGGPVVYPFHQIVLFTLLLVLWAISALDKARKKRTPGAAVKGVAVAAVACLLGTVGMVDYGAKGVMTVIAFYLFRDFPMAWAVQLAAMVALNVVWFKGWCLPLTVAGYPFEFPVQGFAVLALVPIWLYNGKKGPGGRWTQYAAYAFYPLHLLVLYLLFSLLR